jgi:6-pyruvoyltetrahydropterin/6-carboxytetrahydropterin synthase
MYTVAVQREFTARHYMIEGDFGPENQLHSHSYRVEIRLTGPALDRHGFLIDIDPLSAGLEEVLTGLRGKTLNDLPEFQGINPSIEHLARILCRAFSSRFREARLSEIRVTVWESASAWAACTENL